MKAVIVEDEIVAAQNLQRLIAQVDSTIEIIAVIKSIEEAVEWFSSNPKPDLIFMDIHLSDGSSFSIFDKIKIQSPIIFTTAYDEYALKAFEVNSIDYLLKPINIKELERAIEKFTHLNPTQNNEELITNMLLMFKKEKEIYKSNFLIPVKDRFIPLPAEDIAYFYSENKIAKIVTSDNQTYFENNSLDEMQRQVDPVKFFRANRQYIISHKAIKDIFSWFDGKLYIELRIPTPEKIIISKARVSEFKAWYTK